MSQPIDPALSDNQKGILLSVIVPVYNAAPYLKRCIESITNQTYKNLEIILVDDGSKDNSYSICKSFADKDSRIVLTQQANAGSSVARNTGLDLATGQYIAFIDSDDYVRSDMFQKMIDFAIKNKLEVVECGLTSTKNNSNIDSNSKPHTFIETREEAMERLIREKNWSVWRRIYKKNVVSDLRFIPGKIHQDVFFTVDVIDNISRQGYISNQFYIYNTENESITRSAYSLKKLDAKDAPYHVFECAKKYNFPIQSLANKYLIGTLISHYDRLFFNRHLDKDYYHRKIIKKEISEQLNLNYGNASLPALLAKYCPFWLYNIFLKANYYRIKIKLKLLKL